MNFVSRAIAAGRPKPVPDLTPAMQSDLLRHAAYAVACAVLLALAPIGVAHGQGAAATADPGPIAPPIEFADEARRAYTKGLREARDSIGEKRYAEAIAQLDLLLKERPREPHARFLRSVALAEQGQRDAATASLRELAADYPELPEPHNNLAVLYAANGQYELARRELEIALATVPDYAVARENLGDVYIQLAIQEYDRARTLERDNKTVPAKLKLAREIIATGAPAR